MKYQYQPLASPKEEIRLLALLPGSPADTLRVRLWATSLPDLVWKVNDGSEEALAAMQRTLPPDFRVRETPEGRFLFIHNPSEDTSWAHPITGETPPPGQPHGRALTSVPQYEALSYVWGSNEDPDAVLVQNDSEPVKDAMEPVGSNTDPAVEDATAPVDKLTSPVYSELPITRNLSTALRSLRLADRERTLWIDAVCINQSDDGEEKEAQVFRMDAVFTMASRVIFWLGPEDDDSALALSTLSYLGRQVELSYTIGIRYRAPFAREKEWFRRDCQLPYTDAAWRAILNLLNRKYFDRLWIVQEIVMANPDSSVIQCGNDQLTLYLFKRAVCTLAGNHWLPRKLDPRIAIGRIYPLFQWHRGRATVGSVLTIVRIKQCFSPWDKIYGALGIAPPTFAKRISPNYKLSLAKVYTDAFMIALRGDKVLDLLPDCELLDGPESVPGLPSWVPDWSRRRKAWSDPSRFFFSGTSKAHGAYDPAKPHILSVIGRKFGTVKTVGAAAPATIPEALQHMQSWEPDGLLDTEYVGGGSLLDAFLTTLRLGRLGDRWGSRCDTLAAWRQDYLTNLRGKGQSIEQALLKTNMLVAGGDLRSKTFIATGDGYIGLGPPGARPGDITCAILGCRAAMLLREVGDGQFLVVGDCYVTGMDDNTAFLGPLPDGWKVQMVSDGHRYSIYAYRYDCDDGQWFATRDDPRLPPLAHPWTSVPSTTKPTSFVFRHYRFVNSDTGESTCWDPRLTPQALRERGVELQTFDLV